MKASAGALRWKASCRYVERPKGGWFVERQLYVACESAVASSEYGRMNRNSSNAAVPLSFWVG